jgi:hypothetical protein
MHTITTKNSPIMYFKDWRTESPFCLRQRSRGKWQMLHANDECYSAS